MRVAPKPAAKIAAVPTTSSLEKEASLGDAYASTVSNKVDDYFGEATEDELEQDVDKPAMKVQELKPTTGTARKALPSLSPSNEASQYSSSEIREI